MHWAIKTSLITVGLFTTYCASLFLGNIYASKSGFQISNQKQLDSLVNHYVSELHLDSCVQINAYFGHMFTEASSSKLLDDGSYRVIIHPRQRSEGIVKHELYHIADGHCDKQFENGNFFGYYYEYIAEPQAVLYSLTDIKL